MKKTGNTNGFKQDANSQIERNEEIRGTCDGQTMKTLVEYTLISFITELLNHFSSYMSDLS